MADNAPTRAEQKTATAQIIMTDLEAEATAATKAAEKRTVVFEKTGTVGRALFMRQITTPKTNDDTRQERKTTSPTAEGRISPAPPRLCKMRGWDKSKEQQLLCGPLCLFFPTQKEDQGRRRQRDSRPKATLYICRRKSERPGKKKPKGTLVILKQALPRRLRRSESKGT